MTPANPNINHGWRTAALGCLLGLMAAPQLLAIRPAPPLGLGAKILGAGKPVTVKIVPGDALYTSDIIVQRCFPIDCLYYMLGTNRDSSDVPLGTIPEGEEIDLRKAKKIKKIKIKKIKVGPVTIEGIEIVFGATSGEIDEVGDLDFDTLQLTLSDPGLPASGFSELALGAANVPSSTLESQGVSKFDQFHRSLDGATLEPQGGTLTVNRDPAGGENLGVAIDLADVDSFNLTWSRFIPLGLTSTGSSLELGAQGKVNGVPEQDLGTLRVTQLTMADTSAEVTADFSALGSQTQRILVYDGETLIADVTGHTGAAARALAWPTGAGIGQASFGPLPGYALQFPEKTWIQILGDPWMVGDKLIVLAENPTAGVGPVSQLSLRATRLPFISLIDEAVFPLPPPKATPNLRISAAWGSSGVGSSPFDPKLTAYIAVKNTSGVDCYPPTGAGFVIGAYYKSLGLVTATSVGTFPSVIKAGETRYLIAQSLDDPHQSVIYSGFVDFYVSSQAPGQPDLSAATRPACEGEVFLADNNAHSARKVVMNP
ncbi:MAG TPA: hypothetical protein VGX68_03185 [Thermoanaerobaculia bacterium]|nr:hypothetical protein [Thermoanaerobaculia bacterium]